MITLQSIVNFLSVQGFTVISDDDMRSCSVNQLKFPLCILDISGTDFYDKQVTRTYTLSLLYPSNDELTSYCQAELQGQAFCAKFGVDAVMTPIKFQQPLCSGGLLSVQVTNPGYSCAPIDVLEPANTRKWNG